MSSPFSVISRQFASASGGDKTRVFFGLNRQYSLRDRRIKAGPPQPRKVPFHRLGLSPPGTKYFCRDFKNPTTDISNTSFSIEYRPFLDSDKLDKTKSALERILPGCQITTYPLETTEEPFRIIRTGDSQTIFHRTTSDPVTLADLKQIVIAARRY